MQKHEYFEELCALAVAGQLPVDEHKELYSHMRVCDRCRSAARDFVDVLHHLPIEHVELTDRELVDLQEAAGAESFLKRARGEGVVFSRDALESVKPRRSAWTLLTRPVFAVGPALAAIAVFAVAGGLWFALPRKAATPAPQGTVVAPTKSELVASPDPVAAELSRANQQVAALTREKDSLGSQLAAVRKERDATNSLLRQDNELLTTLQPRIVEGKSCYPKPLRRQTRPKTRGTKRLHL